mmetsp:Transcript_26209/g.56206  ORF Transcript_26209/g.56206 Transcript_26209/m.56206 type:complete len:369 (-) Transcript_26209:347-1453(-)
MMPKGPVRSYFTARNPTAGSSCACLVCLSTRQKVRTFHRWSARATIVPTKQVPAKTRRIVDAQSIPRRARKAYQRINRRSHPPFLRISRSRETNLFETLVCWKDSRPTKTIASPLPTKDRQCTTSNERVLSKKHTGWPPIPKNRSKMQATGLFSCGTTERIRVLPHNILSASLVPSQPPGNVVRADDAAAGDFPRSCRCCCRCVVPRIPRQVSQRVAPVPHRFVVADDIGTHLALRPVQGHRTGQDRVPPKDRNTVDVDPPQNGRGQVGPPGTPQVAVHSEKPRVIPVVDVQKERPFLRQKSLGVGAPKHDHRCHELGQFPGADASPVGFANGRHHDGEEDRQTPPQHQQVHRPGPLAGHLVGGDRVL